MKKLVVSFICVILTIMLIACATCEAETTHQLYPMTTVVVEVDRASDIVTCRDFNGNLWQFEGCEDWCENDVASMIMDDMGTPKIFDDEIISVRYDGWIEGWM